MKLAARALCVPLIALALGCDPEPEPSSLQEEAVDVLAASGPIPGASVYGCNPQQGEFLRLTVWPEVLRAASAGRTYAAIDPNRFSSQTWFGNPVSAQTLRTLEWVDKQLSTNQISVRCDDTRPTCLDPVYPVLRMCGAQFARPVAEQALSILRAIAYLGGATENNPHDSEGAFWLARGNPEAAGRNMFNYMFYYNEFL